MFFLFLPTGPDRQRDVRDRAGPSARQRDGGLHLHHSSLRRFRLADASWVISPTALGDNLQKGVLILPVVLIVGAVLWCVLIRFTREPLKVEA